jgi:hypothetical protein
VDAPPVGIATAAPDGPWRVHGLGAAVGFVVGWAMALAFIWRFYRIDP